MSLNKLLMLIFSAILICGCGNPIEKKTYAQGYTSGTEARRIEQETEATNYFKGYRDGYDSSITEGKNQKIVIDSPFSYLPKGGIIHMQDERVEVFDENDKLVRTYVPVKRN